MKITVNESDLQKFDNENSNLKGKAKVIIDDCFLVEVKIIEGANGLRLQMPSRPKTVVDEEGNEKVIHIDTAHPLNAETRKMFEDAVFEVYNKL